jgi:transcriptional regulator with XRE-family HTH domain
MDDQEFIAGIGKNITKMRKRKKMTQRDLAMLAELEEQSIWRIENGKNNNYTIKTLLKISRALDVTIRDLLNVK